jgi:hypothetical protein
LQKDIDDALFAHSVYPDHHTELGRQEREAMENLLLVPRVSLRINEL